MALEGELTSGWEPVACVAGVCGGWRAPLTFWETCGRDGACLGIVGSAGAPNK
jgi:hypothetical protein